MPDRCEVERVVLNKQMGIACAALEDVVRFDAKVGDIEWLKRRARAALSAIKEVEVKSDKRKALTEKPKA